MGEKCGWKSIRSSSSCRRTWGWQQCEEWWWFSSDWRGYPYLIPGLPRPLVPVQQARCGGTSLAGRVSGGIPGEGKGNKNNTAPCLCVIVSQPEHVFIRVCTSCCVSTKTCFLSHISFIDWFSTRRVHYLISFIVSACVHRQGRPTVEKLVATLTDPTTLAKEGEGFEGQLTSLLGQLGKGFQGLTGG